MNIDTTFINLLKKRRSIRKFQERAIERGKIDLLMEAALRSPSSRGFNPWEFIVVSEKETIEKLSAAKPHGASFLAKAPLAIVVCADTKKTDVWVEDASIATLILHLAATDLGLGSCWIQLRLRQYNAHQSAGDYVAKVLELNDNIAVEAIMAIGYPKEQKPPHDVASLSFKKIHYERFGRKYKTPPKI
jgi:nitroreductase